MFIYFHNTKQLLFILLITLAACAQKKDSNPEIVPAKKEVIITKIDSTISNPLKTKTLNLLITNHLNTYFIYKGEEKGLEFELLNLYLKERKIKLNLMLVHDLKNISDSLILKKAHFASATFGEPLDSLSKYVTTDYLYITDDVLVRRKNSPSIISAAKPLKAHIVVDGPFIESYIRTYKHFKNVEFIPAGPNVTKQMLVEDVAEGKIEYAICSKNEAEIMRNFYPNLEVSEVVYPDLKICLVVNPGCKELKDDFNQWLNKKRNKSDFQWTVHKYKNLPIEIKSSMKRTMVKTFTNKISTYDSEIKKHSQHVNWNWKLLAALIYQESKFDPRCKSWVGAMGLMQLMPKTALAYGRVKHKDLYKPEMNLKAGTNFLKFMTEKYFNDPRIDSANKIKFILASYNVGQGHVQDAQALATKYGLNPYVWDGNVAKMLLAKSKPQYYKDKVCKYGYCRGREPFEYVSNILYYYNHYMKN